jgi:DNA-binding XRE family transcriptional regulator
VTQRQLALAVGVNENQICKIETGRAKPNRQLADKIARRLESSAKELFGDM